MEKYRTAYKLNLPPHMKMHPVFHVSQLKLYRRPTEAARTYEKPGPVIVDEAAEEFEVDEIINHRKRKRGRKTKIEYLIVWKGYPVHENTWEPQQRMLPMLQRSLKIITDVLRATLLLRRGDCSVLEVWRLYFIMG